MDAGSIVQGLWVLLFFAEGFSNEKQAQDDAYALKAINRERPREKDRASVPRLLKGMSALRR